MRHRGPILVLIILAVMTTSCGGTSTDPDGADRAVGEDSPGWDVEQAILRTTIIEGALEAGLDREQSSCIIDAALGAGDEFALADLEGVDLSAATSSEVGADVAGALAEALIECGPSLPDYLTEDIPGSGSIPETHAVQAECLTNAYIDAWREAYTDRFRGATRAAEASEDRIPEITDALVGMIAGCDAGGAVLLGASNQGHLDTSALSTLEWTCLDSRLDAAAFMPAFPFPDEPGDALERLGGSVLTEVEFCQSWVAGRDAEEANS